MPSNRGSVQTAALGFTAIQWRAPIPPVAITLATWSTTGAASVQSSAGCDGWATTFR